MVVSEQSERAEIFALLRQKHIMFFYTDQKTKNSWKSYTDCERAKICGIFGSEPYDSPQYSVDNSHGLSVQ